MVIYIHAVTSLKIILRLLSINVHASGYRNGELINTNIFISLRYTIVLLHFAHAVPGCWITESEHGKGTRIDSEVKARVILNFLALILTVMLTLVKVMLQLVKYTHIKITLMRIHHITVSQNTCMVIQHNTRFHRATCAVTSQRQGISTHFMQ